jgi:serine/threonine-protein kinase
MAEASAQPATHGLVLGRYRPLRPLGSGGMGSVWHAFDERKGREVALKIVPRAGNAGPRAEREATAATQLRHPACLRAYALARDDGHVYIAYEYVPGRTFRHALQRGELDDEAAIEATAQILDGLAHAHSRGIVHRDVKPANVLLADEDGSVRILDFGLALVREEEETLTAQGDVPGTLAYISPERLAGKPAGPETDIWSTGVLIWEALAGRHPFGSGPFMEITKRIGRGAPALSSARPDLPKPLARLVDAMLSTDPAKRPPASKLASGLRRAAIARPSASVPRLSVPRIPPVVHRLAPAIPTALLAGLVTGTFAFWPAHWPLLLAGLAALLSVIGPRLGLTFALAMPILPLGNISLGLAALYSIAALAWLVVFWPRPRAALLFLAGPLLAAVGAIALLPLVVIPAGGAARRAVQTVAAMLAAAIAAGLAGRGLPIVGGEAPALALAGVSSPLGALSALWDGLSSSSGLALETIALAAAAAAVGACRRRGPWGGAAFGTLLLGATLLADPHAAALPLVAAAWIAAILLSAEPATARPMSALVRRFVPVRPRLRAVPGS